MSNATKLDTGAYAANEKSLQLLPKYYRGDATKTGVIFAHGHGADALQPLNPTGVYKIINAITENGNPVVSCDLGGNSWGNGTGMTRVSDALTFLRSTMKAKSGKVCVVGYSMGDVTLMNWAAQNLAQVSAVVGVLPICDLQDIYTQSAYTASINTAYGGSYNNATQGSTYNPLVMAQAGKYAGLPWRGYSIADDTIATYSKVQAMVTAIGSSASLVTIPGTGGHGDVTANKIDPNDVLSFLTANGL